MKHNKLVRDKIPDIIKASGSEAKTRVLKDDEYRQELIKKLLEEVAEFAADESAEELADVLEVILTLRENMGLGEEDLDKVRSKKLKERGGFKNKIFLEETSAPEDET